MTDFFDHHDPFEALRSAGRMAVIPTAVAVRRRGHRRQVRVRVVGSVGALAVVTVGAGGAYAAQQQDGGTSPGLVGSSSVSPSASVPMPVPPTAPPITVAPSPTAMAVPPMAPPTTSAPSPTAVAVPPTAVPSKTEPPSPTAMAVPPTAMGPSPTRSASPVPRVSP